MDPKWLEYVRENYENVIYTIEQCKLNPKHYRNYLSEEFLVEIAPCEVQNLVKTLEKCVEIVEGENEGI